MIERWISIRKKFQEKKKRGRGKDRSITVQRKIDREKGTRHTKEKKAKKGERNKRKIKKEG